MRLGMLDHPELRCTMACPRLRFALVDATCSPERLITQTANAGEDVETSSMLLESACYRERADVKFFWCSIEEFGMFGPPAAAPCVMTNLVRTFFLDADALAMTSEDPSGDRIQSNRISFRVRCGV